MFKQTLTVALGLTLALTSFIQAATYGGGTGEPNNPYQIWTPQQINTIGTDSNDWSKHFKLMADIDMSIYTGTQYNIIGNSTIIFTGTFDGNDHIIRNLTYTTAGSVNQVGLFGSTAGTIQNLGLENVLISTGGNYVGALAGANYGTIIACNAAGLVSGTMQTGGLVGFNNGIINSCCASCSASGQDAVGGLVGMNYEGMIFSCYADGSVSGRDGVGGLVGYLYGELTNSYATVAVNGRDGVGGLVGYLQSDVYGPGIVTACYATGSVSKTGSYAGGLVGYNYFGSITACFWDTWTSNLTDGVGNEDPDPAGAMGKTTAQMQTLSTFTSAGWDFTDIDGDPPDWWLPTNRYPRLSWGPYGDGKGTAQDPYQIWTPQQMNAIGVNPNDWDEHFMLMADVNMAIYTGTQYNIIGTSWDNAFSGTFDGNGHIISNLTYTRTASVNYVGLFGYIYYGTIQNVGIENASLSSAGGYVGGLVGTNSGGTISACYVTGSVSGNLIYYGGLVGSNAAGTITACYSTASVSGSWDVGGLVGGNGGIIYNCYAAGPVSGTDFVGGLVGRNNSSLTACFWDIQTSGQIDGVGNQNPDPNGVEGKTTAQMKTLSTFTSAGWDFANVWGIGNGQTYPYLKSFNGINPADINYSGTVDFLDLAILANNWLSQ